MTVSAVCKFTPSPPALVDIKKQKGRSSTPLVAPRLNSAMSMVRRTRFTLPSSRRYLPSNPRISSRSSMMLSMLVNWLNSTTRCPPLYSCCSRMSSTASLPLASTMSSAVDPSKSGSASGNMYGWLHTLRSCMNSACSFFHVSPPPVWPSNASSDSTLLSRPESLSMRRRYQKVCSLLRGHSTLVSMSGGSETSTSSLVRRKQNRRSSLCALASASSSHSRSFDPRWKAASNGAGSEKMGLRKESNAHSSCRLFCRGVPVRSTVLAARTFPSTCARWLSSFFRRWPSSRISRRQ
mmetsp:Transcript_21233/g.35585  ORF Transcript_21233/g.35585 Transcript_21233/m.35585 type:complete len:294 (-) Transcript_21233:425-1306(-)